MPLNRYQIRNVYSLAVPELYKEGDKDDPEALLEGVAMAGFVGVLRQLGDLAEFAAEIFHDLHEEVMATGARGHGLLLRVQQLESEIFPIELACLSQTSHSTFLPSSGIDWHPKQQTTQNLITRGNLPRFVVDSYEECRGPPRLYLLDKFDVSGAGACLKRYTDPSIYKVEAPSYATEISDTQSEKKTRQTKKKGSRWKGGDNPEVLQPSHAKLHQLFLEERVQTGATEAAHRVKLKKRPKKLPFDPETYMNKLSDSPLHAHEAAPVTSNGSVLEDSSITGLASGSPMQNTSPCVSSTKVDYNQITADDEIHTYYPSEDTDHYMDALGTMESGVENIPPVSADSPPPPFARIEIPFHPRVADNVPVTQNPFHDITNDTCTDASSVPNVDQVKSLEQHQNDRKDTAKCTSEPCDILSVADDLSSFSFVDNLKVDELSSDPTFSPATEEISEKQVKEADKESGEKEEVDKVLVICPDDLDNNDAEIPSLYSKVLQDPKQEVVLSDTGCPNNIEEKADQSKSQLTTNNLILPPLPPLPPMQWMMKKSNFPPLFPSTMSLGNPQMNGHSTRDVEIFWPSSSHYPLPTILDEVQNNIRPTKGQRPYSRLTDAVAAHDKTKLRKVSDEEDTTTTPKAEERDTLLVQIRAKSFNLRPAVQTTRPSIQGPTTNLRVAAILEKANAIRQAFAASDDDNESDNWSDS